MRYGAASLSTEKTRSRDGTESKSRLLLEPGGLGDEAELAHLLEMVVGDLRLSDLPVLHPKELDS